MSNARGRPRKAVPVEALLEMRLSGQPLRDIALCYGVNKDTVSEWIKMLKNSYLDGSLSGWPSGKFQSKEYYNALLSVRRFAGGGVKIPKWVPVDLRGEFRDMAREFGEFAAAAHCRSMKANVQ